MKLFTRANLLVLIVAVGLSVGVVRTYWAPSASVCLSLPNCNLGNLPEGELHTVKRGYPLSYREFSYFTTANDTETVSSESEGMSIPHILINILFWYALIELFRSYFNAFHNRKALAPAKAATKSKTTPKKTKKSK